METMVITLSVESQNSNSPYTLDGKQFMAVAMNNWFTRRRGEHEAGWWAHGRIAYEYSRQNNISGEIEALCESITLRNRLD